MDTNNKNDVFWASRVIALLVGIILILASIIMDNYISFGTKTSLLLKTSVNVFSKGISAIGISLVVGFVTAKIQKEDKRRKEEEEKEELKSLLQNTIVSKEFICELDQENKANIIKYCLSANNSNSQMSKYILYKIKNCKKLIIAQ